MKRFVALMMLLGSAASAETIGNSTCNGGAGTLSQDVYAAYLADYPRNGFVGNSAAMTTAQKAMICAQVWAFVQFMANPPTFNTVTIGPSPTTTTALTVTGGLSSDGISATGGMSDTVDPPGRAFTGKGGAANGSGDSGANGMDIQGGDDDGVNGPGGGVHGLGGNTSTGHYGFGVWGEGSGIGPGLIGTCDGTNCDGSASTGNGTGFAYNGTGRLKVTGTGQVGAALGIGLIPGGTTYRLEVADALLGDVEAKFGTSFPLYLRSNWPTIGFNEYSLGAGEVYGATNFAGRLQFDSAGSFNLATAPSGTAGAAATLTTRFTLFTGGEFRFFATGGTNGICVATDAVAADCTGYGPLGVTRPASASNLAYLAMTRAGNISWQQGVSATNHFVMGNTTGGAIVGSPFALDMDSSGNIIFLGQMQSSSAKIGGGTQILTSYHGTCTLNGASPSKCGTSPTVATTSTCTATAVSTSTIAWSPTVSLSGTTLTVTGANAATNVVNYNCL